MIHIRYWVLLEKKQQLFLASQIIGFIITNKYSSTYLLGLLLFVKHVFHSTWTNTIINFTNQLTHNAIKETITNQMELETIYYLLHYYPKNIQSKYQKPFSLLCYKMFDNPKDLLPDSKKIKEFNHYMLIQEEKNTKDKWTNNEKYFSQVMLKLISLGVVNFPKIQSNSKKINLLLSCLPSVNSLSNENFFDYNHLYIPQEINETFLKKIWTTFLKFPSSKKWENDLFKVHLRNIPFNEFNNDNNMVMKSYGLLIMHRMKQYKQLIQSWRESVFIWGSMEYMVEIALETKWPEYISYIEKNITKINDILLLTKLLHLFA